MGQIDDLERKKLSKPIRKIDGIGPNYAEKLAKVWINTVHALLNKGYTKSRRKELAEKTVISDILMRTQ